MNIGGQPDPRNRPAPGQDESSLRTPPAPGPDADRPDRPAPVESDSWRWILAHRELAAACVLAFFTLFAYQPALSGRFVWDDDRWTLGIAGLLQNVSGLWSMWTRPGALMQYYPLTGTSFWIDYQLWGFWTLPYHVENVLLHALAAWLFWNFLRRLQVPAPWLAAGIFALHPLMVESVAWITERKNVLSLALYLGALLVYDRFAPFVETVGEKGPGANQSLRRWSLYALSLLLCLGALLAKTTAFSIPAVILLLRWWQRGKLRWRADVLPTLPFFGLALGLSLVTAWVETRHVGAGGSEWALSPVDRGLVAGRALWFYVGKLFWPAKLCFVYPRWHVDASSVSQWIYPIAAVGVVLALFAARARIGRGPVTAALFYGGTLLPVLGLVNAYYMRYSFVADHWVYVSALGLIAWAAAAVARLSERVRLPQLLFGFAACVLPILGVLTWRHSHAFVNMESLWRWTLASNPDSFMPQNNLALLLLQEGKTAEAETHFRKALDLRPDLPGVQNNFGYLLLQTGRVDESIPYFRKALEISPQLADAHMNLGDALIRQGQLRQAIAQYQAALQLEPTNVPVLYKLCWVLGTATDSSVRDGSKAVALGEQADRLSGSRSEAVLGVLAAAYADTGRFQDAIATVRRALALPSARANPALSGLLRSQLQSYEESHPFRDPALTNAAPRSGP
jgi:tetratricopeptide (TPR) repeat protein